MKSDSVDESGGVKQERAAGRSDFFTTYMQRDEQSFTRVKENPLLAVDHDTSFDDVNIWELLRDFWFGLRSTVLQTLVYARLSWHDAKRRKGAYCLGFFSIFLVVLLCGVLLTVLSNLQLVFLKLAESANGKMDVVVKPGGQFSLANSLNYSVFQSLLASVDETSYSAARIVLPSMTAYNLAQACANFQASNLSTLWNPVSGGGAALQQCSPGSMTCVAAHCTNAPYSPSTLVFLDPAAEDRMGLTAGNWPYRPNPGEVIISGSVAASLQLSVGDQILLLGDVSYPLMEAFNEANLDDLGVAAGASGVAYTSHPYAAYAFTVAYVTDDTDEKFEDDITNVVVGNFADAVALTATALSPAIDAVSRMAFSSVPSSWAASRVYFNLPPSTRQSTYSATDYVTVQSSIMEFSTRIFGRIGFSQVQVSTPILTYLNSVRFFSLFLGLIVSLIILGLGVLSIVLIFSLLTVNIESRTFEMGLQRMLGFTKLNLTGLVFTNAMFYAVPAWAVGLIAAQVAFLLIRSVLASLLKVTLPSSISALSVGIATLAGIGIPLVSTIAPVRHVLTLSLPESLDTDRGRGVGILYFINGRKTTYFSVTLMLLGVAFTLYGFAIYYLFPIALLNFNITLLFYVFFGILVAMLAGLVLLAMNFESVVETVVAGVFFYVWEQRAVFSLISKALAAHRQRNRTTSMMFALSLGFIIFITVAFTIQLNSIQYSSLMSLGGDARYRGSLQWEEFVVFDALLQDPQTSSLVQRGLVNDVTWITDDLKGQRGFFNSSISNIGQFQTNKVALSGVPPKFYDLVDQSFVIVGSAVGTPLSLSAYLYSAAGTAGCIMSTSDKDSLNLISHDDVFLFIDVVGDEMGLNTTKVKTVVAPSAWLDASSVVRMSSNPQSVGLNALLSMPAAVNRGQGAFRSVRDISLDSFVFKVAESDVQTVSNALSLLQADMNSDVSLTTIYTTKKTLSTATTIVNIFFTFTQVMTMLICSFSLLSSMSTNVLNHSKEIGILRSMGMKKFPIHRLYTWEAFVLILSSSLLGLVVGIVVAYSMMLQNSLLTQIPLTFTFPITQLIAILIASLVLSFVASFSPVAYLLNQPSITHILRRVN